METMALVGIIASGLLLLTIIVSVQPLKKTAPGPTRERAARTHALVSLAAVVVIAATLVINWLTVRGA